MKHTLQASIGFTSGLPLFTTRARVLPGGRPRAGASAPFLRFWFLALLAVWSCGQAARAQFFLDCSCLATQSVLITNACQAVVPDLCQFTNCYQSTVVPPPPLTCSQNPPPGTPVGPGTYTITVSVFVPGTPPQTCALPFQVNPPPGGCVFTLNCASNKAVECGSAWTFDPPTYTNECPDPTGGPGNVTLTVLSTTTNGSCPWTITQTWQGVDDCGAVATCSQTVTVVDTTPPALDCRCLTNSAGLPPLPLTVTNCSAAVPDLCQPARLCAFDQCGPLTCTQSPPAGTVVGPGVYPITVSVLDCAGNSASCTLNFTVVAPAGGCVTNPPCDTFTNVWNTGMNGGNPLPPGAPDPTYTLVSAPPGGCTGPAQVLDPSSLPSPPWVANGPNSQWIGGGLFASCEGGVYHYRICFYLPCTDGASIVGQWAADDIGVIHLNGQPTGITSLSTPTYQWAPVSITNGFVCGTNCLDFYVTNALIGINPTGFRAELTNVFNDCCCPAPQPLFSLFSGQTAAGPLNPGAPDTQFALTCAPAGVNVTTPVAVVPHPAWLPNGPNSQWIGPNQFNNGPAGVYCYSLRFVIPCPPGAPIKASLSGQWSADDTGTIHLNGQPTGNTLPNGWAFVNWSPINITSGFVPGVNTLTFYVTNAGGPTGLRVELSATASCCACTNPPDCSCTFTNGNFDTFVPVNGTGGGWTSSGLFAGAGWQSSGGNPDATFLLNNVGDPATDPTLSQTLCCLTPGQCYTIRGQRKVQAWFGQTQPSFAVLLDGAPVLVLPVPSNPADTNWYDFAVSFTASNACQTIGFAAEYAGSDVSYWIDNIRLECCQTNSCIQCPPLNQTVVGCPPLMPDFTTNSFSGPGCTPIGPLTVTQSIPPGTPLPPGSPVVVVLRVCDATGQCRDCDVIVHPVSSLGTPTILCPPNRVLLTCSNSAIAKYKVQASGSSGPVVCTPPSGSPFPLGTTVVTCTATNACGGIATCSFTVTVKPQKPRWLCWQHLGIGIPFEPIGGATVALRPVGPGLGGPAICVFPNPANPGSGIRLDPGAAQAISFTTVLDFTAEEGAGIDLVLPPDPAHPNDPPILSMRSKGPKGYCVKMNKKFADEPGALYRVYAVNTNGDLLEPVTFTSAEVEATGIVDIGFQPGVSNCHVEVTLDCKTGGISIGFDGPITPSALRKGWDGCIYGPDRPRPKPPKTARVIFVPPVSPGQPPITDLRLVASGYEEVTVEEPALTARERKWSDGHVTLMKAYDDGESLEFAALADGGGVSVDLGHTESFTLRLTRFETNPLPGEYMLTRTIGPIRGLTNRPPPPFLDALLLEDTGDGVACSADFSNIESPTVRVLIYSGGALVAERTGVTGQIGQPVFTLPEWPQTLGKLGGRTPCRVGTIRPGPIRLPSGGGAPFLDGLAPAEEIVFGDEFRVIAEPPPEAVPPDFYSAFEFIVSEDADWGVSDLERTPACAPGGLHIARAADGVVIAWPDENYRLQGAVDVTGPWFDLGAGSPVSLGAGYAARFFRLVCD